MTQVNIVIPTYNGRRFLEPLYQALRNGISGIDHIITIVDDGSTDGTSTWVKSHPDINFVSHNGVNQGFSKACNHGAASVDSEWVLFLNNDTEPQPGFLEEMLKTANSPVKPEIVGAKLLFKQSRLIQHAGIHFMAMGYPYEFGRGRPADDPECNKTGEADAVTGACMLVKKKLFDKLDGFDEQFVNGWEDVDLALKAKEHGARIYYCHKAVVLHYLFGSEGRFAHENHNKQLFRKKWIHEREIYTLTPFWLAIAATWACNLKCKHCSIWKRESGEALSLEDFPALVASEFFDNITNVAIFGGEPTLHPKIVDLIAIVAARWRGKEIGLVTNGYPFTWQKKVWEAVHDNLSGNFVIRVSLDGREKIHDELRGIKGTFANAVDTTRLINSFWPGKGGISITVYPDTLGELPYLIDFVEKLGVTFCIRVGVSGSYFGGKVLGKWDPEKINNFESIIKSIPDKLMAFDRYVHQIPRFLRTGEHAPCEAYRKALVLTPDMMVSVCHERKGTVHLRDVPRWWGKTADWCKIGYECLTDACWKESCAIDGPSALNLISE